MIDGITISTGAISALLGAGGGAVFSMLRRGRRCDTCDAHGKMAEDVIRTREDIAEIKADIRNVCRSLDALRARK